MAEPKPASRRALQLEYRFDRLLSEKLVQVYQALVPDKRWSTGGVLLERAKLRLEVIDEQDSGDLRARLFRPTEGESHDRQPDGGVERVRRRKRL